MNKQELIEKIKANGEWFETNRYVKITKVIELVNQIDEPQKVKVPAFVAEKMKRYKSALWMLSSEYFDTSLEVDSDELTNWIDQNSEEFFRAWLDGYEVEEESKYEVVFREDADDRFLLMQLNEHIYEIAPESENDGYRSQWFTEQEIKSIDERYWKFAVAVEKV